MFSTFKLTQQQQALCDYKTVIGYKTVIVKQVKQVITGISNSNQKIMLIAK